MKKRKEEFLAKCPDTKELLSKKGSPPVISDWNLGILECTRDQLITLTWSIFEDYQFMEKFQISKESFLKFIWELRWHYDKRENPFHNFSHGFAVIQALYHVIKWTSLSKVLDDLSKFTLLLSGLCHDANHTGKNNGFEAATLSKLAIRYNDKWVSTKD